MSSKRKWDQAAPEDDNSPHKAAKAEDSKSASEAAAAAAAIAAKIAASFAGSTGSSGGGTSLGPKDPHDGEFTHDIDINDVRNRYLLTKGATQVQVRTCCAVVLCTG
jgi:hypothetical protein